MGFIHSTLSMETSIFSFRSSCKKGKKEEDLGDLVFVFGCIHAYLLALYFI